MVCRQMLVFWSVASCLEVAAEADRKLKLCLYYHFSSKPSRLWYQLRLKIGPVNQACFFVNLGEDNLEVMWCPVSSIIAISSISRVEGKLLFKGRII